MSRTRELIDAIGRVELSEALGVKTGAISAAVVADIMPAAWYQTVHALAKTKGLEAPEDLFSWKIASAGPSDASA